MDEPNDTVGAKAALMSIGSFFWELIKVFLIAVVIIIPVRYFLVQPFFVRGASMEPSYEDGEYLVVDELSYRWREPQRGEVIVFRYPNNPSQFFIKRIIGLPGDTVRVNDGRVVIQNDQYQQGVVLDESGYLSAGTRTGGQLDVRLGSDEYFVMGDNRSASSDSRSWGPLKRFEIVGRTWIRAYPFDRFSVFEIMKPGYLSLQ
ncbi:MAG: signal peptidase I [Candidatus Andersenbacteria bacterium]|nr:signal peptidase I [bacterium]MDZ4225378.1 signal peptidase I [Candidatus Andersenbacteria bacterium]